MKVASKETAKQVEKVATKQARKVVSKQAVKSPSNYNVKVLQANKQIKQVSKTIGGARAIILTMAMDGVEIDKQFIQVLKASKKKPENYKVLTKYVTLAGNAKGFTPFRLLQCLNKHIDSIREEMTF